jgi:hypothetical protein
MYFNRRIVFSIVVRGGNRHPFVESVFQLKAIIAIIWFVAVFVGKNPDLRKSKFVIRVIVLAVGTDEQKNVIRRDFIVKNLSNTSGDCPKSHLFIEFASLHFPDEVKLIKDSCNETYKKRHNRIQEKILALQPPVEDHKVEDAEIVTEAQPVEIIAEKVPVLVESEESTGHETFDDHGFDEIPLCPELPEHAVIGDVPEELEEHIDMICEEIAA